MVSSPMYERLMQFAESAPENEKLYGWDDEHSTVVRAIRKAQEKVEHFKDHQGFTGQAGDAMSAEAVRALQRFNGQANYYLTGMSYYVEARRAIMLAAEEARQLSPTLLDPMTEAMRDVATVTIPVASNFGLPGQLVNSLAVTGAAYVDAVEAQANAQREAKSTEIIERLESTMNNLSTRLKDHTSEGPDTSNPDNREGWTPIPEIPKDSADALEKGHIIISPYEGGAYGRSRSDAFGNADLRGSDSGLYPGGYNDGEGVNQRVMQSPRLPSRYFPEGEAGSRTNPISDPQDLMDMDLLHTRVNGDRHANGVIGGHTPASPVDRDHPLWRLNGGPATESSTASRLGGAGMLGAGALGLRGSARMGSAAASMGRAGGAGVGGSAASAALRTGSYSGAGFGKYTPPAPAGATGVGTSGTSGVTGTSGAPGGANGAGSSTAGGRTQGAGGFMGAGGAGAGGKKDEKKAQRRRYTPFRFEDDEDELPEGYVNPLSQTYGSDKDIAPVPRKDDGWDPRQW